LVYDKINEGEKLYLIMIELMKMLSGHKNIEAMQFLFPIKLLFLILFLQGGIQINSQCISFARNIAKPQLAPYVHDGNYNAAYMEEGETAELYKTFFKGEEYKLVVSGIESLPKLHFRVLDDKRNVVFDNANFDFAQEWVFSSESTGTMIVHVRVPDSDSVNITAGCVAILFGVKVSGRGR
jgi:hypothetical protein